MENELNKIYDRVPVNKTAALNTQQPKEPTDTQYLLQDLNNLQAAQSEAVSEITNMKRSGVGTPLTLKALGERINGINDQISKIKTKLGIKRKDHRYRKRNMRKHDIGESQ